MLLAPELPPIHAAVQDVTWRLGAPVAAADFAEGESGDAVVLRVPAVTLQLAHDALASDDLAEDAANFAMWEGSQTGIGASALGASPLHVTLEAPSGALTATQLLRGVAELLALRRAHGDRLCSGGDTRIASEVGEAGACAADTQARLVPRSCEGAVFDGMERLSTAGRLPVVYAVRLIL